MLYQVVEKKMLMSIVDIQEAKTTLSQLVDQVLAGEEVTLTESSNPIAKLVHYQPSEEAAQTGSMGRPSSHS